ncbi:hypothetical protein TNCV_3714131 [Trichonephila clavipes]|nr:hypothetical protein TNCV_3714131 [Trichonephila clavipes]
MNLRKCLWAYGLQRTIYPVSGKSLLDETTKLEYHAEGVLHGYWTVDGEPVSGASMHGIWLLRCFLENGVHIHTAKRERLFLLASEDNGSKWLPGKGGDESESGVL